MKPVTPEESVRIREAYKTGGPEAAKAMRAEILGGPRTGLAGPSMAGAKCPTCQSDRLQRISPGGKVVKVAAFGVFGLGDVHKIFKCLNCGYKW